jgi:hypothetical protein
MQAHSEPPTTYEDTNGHRNATKHEQVEVKEFLINRK